MSAVLALVLVPGFLAIVTERAGICRGRGTAALQLLLPWWAIVAAGVAVAAALRGAWLLGAIATVLVAGIGAVVLPKLFRRRPRGRPHDRPGQGFSVGLANLYVDNPEPDAAVRQLLEAAPEVLVLTELSADLLARFDAAGGRDRYPHRVHPHPLDGEYEAGIFSEYPFATSEVHDAGALQVVEAVVDLPGGPVRVVAAHPEAPTTRDGFRTWRRQLRDLRALMAAASPATVVLGDLNAGTLQPPYEALLTTPFRDAHDLFGSSLAPSWGVAPAFPRWVPTFVARLDHLLIGPGVDVFALSDLDPVGSDHRPFVATLSLR